MSFAAIGALVMAHHGQGGDPLALLLAAVVCAVVGALVALPRCGCPASTWRWRPRRSRCSSTGGCSCSSPSSSARGRSSSGRAAWSPVDPVDIPGIDTTDRQTQLVVLACVAALGYLLVVAVRRSSFGQRLLAMKDSPAACATLGIDITRLKLGVFALSAAMAGVAARSTPARSAR